MSNRMIRRESSGYWSDTKHILLVASILLAIILTAGPLQRELVQQAFIDLKSVKVEDHALGENPKLVATRKIHQNFVGRFSVTIRHAVDNRVACLTSWSDWFPYSKPTNGSPTELHYPSDLREWVGDTPRLDGCIRDGRYGPGLYYLQTCHFVKIIGPFHLHRCMDGAVYERREK